MNFFDSHAHYDDGRFDGDRDALLRSLPEQGIAYVLNAGTNLQSSRECIDLAERYPFAYASVGVHPHEAGAAPEDFVREISELAGHPKVQAIGEIGLDYHYDFAPRDRQREVFRLQLELARKLDLPVIIHDRKAHADTMALLRELCPRGVVHCFSGSAQMAREVVDLGMYVGFTGVVTFPGARKTLEAARAVPLDRLLLETDCPYLSPVPHRGERCDSSMLPHTAKALADARGEDVRAIVEASRDNAKKVYKII